MLLLEKIIKKLIPDTIWKIGIEDKELTQDFFDSANSDFDFRIISIDCSTVPSIEMLIDKFIDQLSKVALAIWPNWFEENSFLGIPKTKSAEFILEMENRFERWSNQHSDFSKLWLKDAINACLNDKSPNFETYPKPIQISFLSKVIHPTHLIALLQITNNNPKEGQLSGIVSAAKWFMAQSNASIGIVLPKMLLGHPELVSIYDEIFDDGFASSMNESAVKPEKENKSIVWPIIGKPHPFSPGEQLLAKWLAKDAELRELFHFNTDFRTTLKKNQDRTNSRDISENRPYLQAFSLLK